MTVERDLTEDQKKQIVPKNSVSSELLVRIKCDKLKNWQTLKKEIELLLDNPEWIEAAITLVYGPQLVYTMRHPRIVQSMTHFKTSLYDMFTTQYKMGNDLEFSVWLLGNRDGNISTKHARFRTSSVVTALTFVSKHGVYLAFTQDLFLKVFTDRFVEVHKIFWLTTVLCLVYNRVLDEIYVGGIGLLEIWKIHGTEVNKQHCTLFEAFPYKVGERHAAVPVLVKKCAVSLTEDDWVQEIKFDNNLDLLYAMCGMGIVVFSIKVR
ncbi:hypothetical protein CHS0354_036298 [Potamilus streckersoni]|uniref:Uncharacterized protein n=1 Tax=Potamilus streckersoni TaxID=2493646 RepID=A0AAE0T7P9_9BIVA|nr:hypothetical protein CHS0354_036298 [Potamilus streckersoni]